MNPNEEPAMILSASDREAADAAVAAALSLSQEGGPLSEEAVSLMKSGGYDVSFELKVRKTGARLAVDSICSGDYDLASSILSALNEHPELAHVGWELYPESESEGEGEPSQDDVAEEEEEPEQDDTEVVEEAAPKAKTRMDVIREAAAKVYSDESDSEVKRSITRAKEKSPYPLRAMGLADAEAFMAQYSSNHRTKDVQCRDGVCKGSRMTLDGRPVTVIRVLGDGTAMVNRSGTRYHSIVHVQNLKGLYPAREAEPFEAKAGDRVSVSLCDVADGPKTASRAGTVSAVIKPGLVDVKMDDNGSICTYPSWCLSGAGS